MFESSGGFANFWHYNKLKIIGIVLLLAFIVFAISQCSFGESADFSVLHISEVRGVTGDEFIEKLKQDVEISSEEAEADVEFISIYVPKDPRDIMETGALEHMQVELVSGRSSLFILDEETLYSYKNDEMFYDLTSVADKYMIPEDARYLGPNGETLAISVDGNAYLDSCSLENKSLFIAIRLHEKEDSAYYKNAFNALEYIISNR